GFSWSTRTFEKRRTPRLMISSLDWSDSAPSKGAHWNGVHGLGTNDETDRVSRPNGRPVGSRMRSRSSIRLARSGIASTSSMVSVGCPIMKYVFRFGMPGAGTRAQAAISRLSLMDVGGPRGSRQVPAYGTHERHRW